MSVLGIRMSEFRKATINIKLLVRETDLVDLQKRREY